MYYGGCPVSTHFLPDMYRVDDIIVAGIVLAAHCGIKINVNITMQYFFYSTYEITSII